MAVESNPGFAISAAALACGDQCLMWVWVVLLLTSCSPGPFPCDTCCVHRILLSAKASHDWMSMLHVFISVFQIPLYENRDSAVKNNLMASKRQILRNLKK